MLEHLGVQSHPMLGTPAWRALPDEHPVKLAAAFDAAQHWALRVDTAQEQLVAAAQAISAAEDWSAIARVNRDRADFTAANPWARRVVEDGSGTAKTAATTKTAMGDTALGKDAENGSENTTLGTDAENTTMTTTLAEGTSEFATANRWARRVVG
jgi:hypothetical protein